MVFEKLTFEKSKTYEKIMISWVKYQLNHCTFLNV